MTTTKEATTTLRIEREISAPRAKVYEAWTNADMLKQWQAPGDYTVPYAEADVRVGGTYRIVMKPPAKDITHTILGEYHEVVPNEKLVYTWQWEEDHDGVGETLVTVLFSDFGEGTKVAITHERFPDDEQRDKHGMGWTGCLDNLEKFVHLYQKAAALSPAAAQPIDMPMSTATAMYVQQTGLASFARNEFMLKDISDEDSLWQPEAGVPPIAWHVAHIGVSEAILILGMNKNQWDFIGEDWIEQYRMGCTLPEDVSTLRTLSEVRPEMERLRQESVAFLHTLKDGDLHRDMPYRREGYVPEFLRTTADCLKALPVHEGHHNGAITVLRRLMGKVKN